MTETVGMDWLDNDWKLCDWQPSKEWLQGEYEVDEHIRAGRVRRFASVAELVDSLHNEREKVGCCI